jgi:hypothetical protein
MTRKSDLPKYKWSDEIVDRLREHAAGYSANSAKGKSWRARMFLLYHEWGYRDIEKIAKTMNTHRNTVRNNILRIGEVGGDPIKALDDLPRRGGVKNKRYGKEIENLVLEFYRKDPKLWRSGDRRFKRADFVKAIHTALEEKRLYGAAKISRSTIMRILTDSVSEFMPNKTSASIKKLKSVKRADGHAAGSAKNAISSDYNIILSVEKTSAGDKSSKLRIKHRCTEKSVDTKEVKKLLASYQEALEKIIARQRADAGEVSYIIEVRNGKIEKIDKKPFP